MNQDAKMECRSGRIRFLLSPMITFDLKDASSEFLDYLEQNLFTDIELEVSGRKFPIHKMILSKVSPFFKRAFLGGFKENSEKTMRLQGFNPVLFERLLLGFYGKQIPIESWRQVLDYHRMCDYLMKDLISLIWNFSVFVEIFQNQIDLVSKISKKKLIFRSWAYCPTSELTTYRMIRNLISKDRTRHLYALINPRIEREKIPPKDLKLMISTGTDEINGLLAENVKKAARSGNVFWARLNRNGNLSGRNTDYDSHIFASFDSLQDYKSCDVVLIKKYILRPDQSIRVLEYDFF